MPRGRARNFPLSKTGFVLFQVAFIVIEMFVFYPCLVHAPIDDENVVVSEQKRLLLPRQQLNDVVVRPQQQQQQQEEEGGSLFGGGDNPKMKNVLVRQQQVLDPGARIPNDPARRVVYGGGSSSNKESPRGNAAGPYKPDWDSLDSRPIPAWYDEAKVGIFLHWGVYSVPSYVETGHGGLAEWFWYYLSSSTDETSGHNVENFNSVRSYMKRIYPQHFKYADFAPAFSAELFNATEWADLFSASGARYIVLTSKHHEGFTLWGSKKSWNWNAVDVGPHMDLIEELSVAVRKIGMKFGLYHSLYEWFNPTYLEDKKNGFTTQNYIKDKLMPEMTDLVMRFHPDILWGDGDWEATCSYWNTTEFFAWLYNESPVKDSIVINDRWGKDARCKHGGFMTCDDRYNPGTLQPRKWENCMTIDKESWGYRRNANVKDYFTIEELLETLVVTVSCGGNLLMNIGPTSDGRIIPLYQERLRQFGGWLEVNGEAIYGSKPWRVQLDLEATKVWYTSKPSGKGTDVYALVLEMPANGKLELSAPKATAETKVTWLGYRGDITFHAKQTGLTINIPRLLYSEIPCQWAWVFKLSGIQ